MHACVYGCMCVVLCVRVRACSYACTQPRPIGYFQRSGDFAVGDTVKYAHSKGEKRRLLRPLTHGCVLQVAGGADILGLLFFELLFPSFR